MEEKPREHPSEFTARMLRAFSHPLRIRLGQILMNGRARNVSELAELVDEPPNSVSFHIRQLAKAGLVEQVPGPDGTSRRESWWRMSAAGLTPFPIRPSEWQGRERTENMRALRTMFTADFLDRLDGLLAALDTVGELQVGYYEFRWNFTDEEARGFLEKQHELMREMRAASDAHRPGDDVQGWTVAMEMYPEVRPERRWTVPGDDEQA